MPRKYGWKPEKPDRRDLIYKRSFKLFFPRKVDLRGQCSQVEDQGVLGSCTGNACAGALEYLDARDGNGYVDLSRLMIYYNGRMIEGTVSEDAGAYIRDVIKGLARYGVCPESMWLYDPAQFAVRPTQDCYLTGAQHRIREYRRISSVSDVLNCLGSGYPVVCGITIYPSFESDEVARTGVVNMPGENEAPIGGHAVLIVGYDMDEKRVIVRNSWGTGWGQRGYFTLPFAYLEQMGSDFWQIKR